MAILDKIRRRTSLLILIIGLSIFAFVVSDLISKGGGGSGQDRNIGTVNGEELSDISVFSQRVNQNAQNAPNLSNMLFVNSLWNQELQRVLFNQKAEEIGIRVDVSMFKDIAQQSGAYRQYSIFLDDTGNFDMTKYANFMRGAKTNNPNAYSQLIDQENFLLEQEKQNIYNTMILASMNYTNLEAETKYQWSTDKIDLSYVQVPYTTIADSLVDVTDAEVKNYMNAHKSQFEQKPTANLQYVFFEEKSSAQDDADIQNELKKLLTSSEVYNNVTNKNEMVKGFTETTNDKEFVNINSDVSFNDKYVFESQLPSAYAQQIISLPNGQIYGPYKENKYYKITKKIAKISLSDSVKSSHIIVPYIGSQAATATTNKTKAQAKTYIDSLYNVVRRDASKFVKIADSINVDGTKGRGGAVGWTVYSKTSAENFDKNYSDFIFFNSKGKMSVIETAFGFHIIKIDDKKKEKDAYMLATIAKAIEPSEETINQIYQDATEFELQVTQNNVSFDEAVKNTKDNNIINANNVTLLQTDLSVIGDQRAIVKWSHNENTQQGDIKRFSVNNGYVIVQLTSKKEGSTMNVQDARAIALPQIKKDKKAAMLIGKNGGKSYEELSADSNVKQYTATAVNLNKVSLPGVGIEPKVVGSAFRLEEGQFSEMIAGNNGVYKIKVTKKEKAPKLQNYTIYMKGLNKYNDASLKSALFETIKKSADIEDNRHLFY